MEPFEKRLSRLLNGDPREFALNIRVSYENDLVHQIRYARENWGAQPVLMLLAIHSAMQTISDYVFGKQGPDGTKFYLENFIDGTGPGEDFSAIAAEIHEARNVLAHRWSSSLFYRFVLNPSIERGWLQRDGCIHFNPLVFADRFLASWADSNFYDRWRDLVKEVDMEVHQLRFVRDWLELRGSNDEIDLDVNKLLQLKSEDEKADLIKELRELVRRRYLQEPRK